MITPLSYSFGSIRQKPVACVDMTSERFSESGRDLGFVRRGHVIPDTCELGVICKLVQVELFEHI